MGLRLANFSNFLNFDVFGKKYGKKGPPGGELKVVMH